MKLRALLLSLIVAGFAAPASAQVDFIYGQLAHPCSALGNNFVTGAINECIDPTTNVPYYYNGSWLPLGVGGPLTSPATIKQSGGTASLNFDAFWQLVANNQFFGLLQTSNSFEPIGCILTDLGDAAGCEVIGNMTFQSFTDDSQVEVDAPTSVSGGFRIVKLPPAAVAGSYWYDAAGDGVLTEFNPGTPAALSAFGTCNSAHEGQYRTQNNSTAGCSAGTTATSSGTTHCAIYCNGTNWKQTGL